LSGVCVHTLGASNELNGNLRVPVLVAEHTEFYVLSPLSVCSDILLPVSAHLVVETN